jgi:arylsulfatase A-like enzyme
LLLTVDTLRAQHVGLYGYGRDTTPHIDRFFADGLVYLRAYSTTASTSPSVISLLTGRLPHEHRVRLLWQLVPEELQVITDLLPPEYQSAAFVSNVLLSNEAMGVAGRFDHYDDFVDEKGPNQKFYERSARRTTDAALHWLRNSRNPRRPLFLWVHYMDPHGPYGPPDDWKRSFSHPRPRPVPKGQRVAYVQPSESSDALDYVDGYDEEIAYMDFHVGRLLDGYAALHPIDDALVVLTADHGETMMEHEVWFGHGYQVYEAIVRVPLMLRGPGVLTGRVELGSLGVDVAPTILRFVGAGVPATMPSVDLRNAWGLDPKRVLVVEATLSTHQWKAAIQGQQKWMIRVSGKDREISGRRAYDLSADPREHAPRRWRRTEPIPAQLIELSRTDPDPAGVPSQYREGMLVNAPKVAPRAGPEILEMLKALGYAE